MDRGQGQHREPRPGTAAHPLRREGQHGSVGDRERVLQASETKSGRDRDQGDAEPRPRARHRQRLERGRRDSAHLRQALHLSSGPTGSTLSHLEGGLSGRSYDPDELRSLDPLDQRPLLARYDLERAARTLNRTAIAARTYGGPWRWREGLAVRRWESVVPLRAVTPPLPHMPRKSYSHLQSE